MFTDPFTTFKGLKEFGISEGVQPSIFPLFQKLPKRFWLRNLRIIPVEGNWAPARLILVFKDRNGHRHQERCVLQANKDTSEFLRSQWRIIRTPSFCIFPVTVQKYKVCLKNPWASNRKRGHRRSRDSSYAKMKIALKIKKRYLILLIIKENKWWCFKDTTFCVLWWKRLEGLTNTSCWKMWRNRSFHTFLRVLL